MTHLTRAGGIAVAQVLKLAGFPIMLFDTRYAYNPLSSGQAVYWVLPTSKTPSGQMYPSLSCWNILLVMAHRCTVFAGRVLHSQGARASLL